MKIAMTGVHVNDPIRAFQFYTEVLGFAEHTYMPEHFLAIVVAKDQPKGTALLLEPSNNPLAKNYQEGLYNSGIPAIVFSVDDIEKEVHRLKELGVPIKKEPTQQPWGIEAIFDDTCGNWIQIIQQ